MKVINLKSMVKGWFIGDFEPTVLKTKDFEVAVKYYKKGDSEETHVHKIATEITVVISGRVRMSDHVFSEGDIVTIEPGEYTDFVALEDAATVCVKSPSVKGDKYNQA